MSVSIDNARGYVIPSALFGRQCVLLHDKIVTSETFDDKLDVILVAIVHCMHYSVISKHIFLRIITFKITNTFILNVFVFKIIRSNYSNNY